MRIATGSQAPAPTAAGAKTENTPAPNIAPAPMAAASTVPSTRAGPVCGPEEVVNGVSLPGYTRHGRGRALFGEPLRRSEEHTSELQSRGHLVCRLLLENKKK